MWRKKGFVLVGAFKESTRILQGEQQQLEQTVDLGEVNNTQNRMSERQWWSCSRKQLA